MKLKRPSIILLLVLFSTACISQVTPTEIPTVMVSTEAPITPTATPDCQHMNGVTLDILRISDTKITLQIHGLQPGESPFITYSTTQNGMSKRGEMGYFVKGADTQGYFTTQIVGLQPPAAGQTTATWDIRVVHARGVECATITLP